MTAPETEQHPSPPEDDGIVYHPDGSVTIRVPLVIVGSDAPLPGGDD